MSVLPQRSESLPNNDGGILRKGARLPGPTAPNGAVLGDIWYDTVEKALKVWNGTAWDKIMGAGVSVSGGTITADRLKIAPDDVDDAKIDLYGGTYLIGIRSNSMYFRSGGNRFDFETPGGSWAMNFGPNEVNNARGFKVQADLEGGEVYSRSWFRTYNDNCGWYHQVRGGGWYMYDTWLRSYNDHNVYTAGENRASVAAMHHWRRDGAYAAFGHYAWNEGTDGSAGKGYAPGYMQHANGNCLVSCQGNFRIRKDLGDGDFTMLSINVEFTSPHQKTYAYFGGGEVDLRAWLPALGGSTMIWANGSGQMGWASSTEKIKTNIRPLDEKGFDRNPIWKLTPKRFSWREDKVANAKEYNDRVPTGFAGLIAEEVANLMPDAAHYDLDGNVVNWDERVVTGYMLEALHDLKKEIDNLKKVK